MYAALAAIACSTILLSPDLTLAAETRKPVKLFGQIDQVVTACAAAGFRMDHDSFPAKVDRVSPGTAAFYSGLRANDKIISGVIESDRLIIDFEREGKKYRVRLATTPQLKMSPKTDQHQAIPELPVGEVNPPENAITEPRMLEGNITEKDAQLLARYDVVLVIDRSGSMGGFKWEWCQKETTQLSRALEKVARTITIVTFNSNFDIERNCHPQRVEQIFHVVVPSGGTNASAPLDALLKEEHSSKPLLVAVITDGLPNEGRPLQDVLIEASQAISNQDQITITFLEVGNSFEGDSFLKALDNDLVAAGAKHDIVDTKPFEELEKIGLAKALVAALQEKKSTVTTGDTKAARATLDEALKKALNDLAKLKNASPQATR